MSNIFGRYWKALATASASMTSYYFLSNSDYSQKKNSLLSVFKIQAAEYERRNAGKTLSKTWQLERRKNIDDDNEDDDEDKDENEKDDLSRTEEKIKNIREKRFYDFASIEYDEEIFMTPVDFLESVIAERPRPRIGRRQLTDSMVDSILYNTPPKHRGSNRFFRNLEDTGLISYAEYLFLWVILTKPSTQFEIVFALFDIDGNQLVDKHEFLVFGRVMSDKRMIRRQSKKHSTRNSNRTSTKTNSFHFDDIERTDTTLLVHFFGKNGRDTLNYTEFKRFMENLQTEVLEIEFHQYSHGFKAISDLGFAEMLLCHTNFDHDTKKFILKKVKTYSDQRNEITFEQFKHFFAFLTNLEEFGIAIRFHQLSNKPISQAEFQRAVKISMGFELESHLIALIFRIFDSDNDQHLSYDEFMTVMKDRLSRNFQANDYRELPASKFDQFKHCVRERAKRESIFALN
ncbi:unnamed protein product [Rotaria magnacalcarata]|uniref:EF-hand domain-containing protein n=3 Tax=Rotaria magnacalcarata TaxID=392030 RepID=A0A815Z5E7_9BILA|nr:unnamed protein product [Rotaria magnacalcarata]CAF2062231.1 unnamed protein product [Rotaria magnacalcarata]CAF3959476.1 unnamed protein product [Rotaria magnacalcarata]